MGDDKVIKPPLESTVTRAHLIGTEGQEPDKGTGEGQVREPTLVTWEGSDAVAPRQVSAQPRTLAAATAPLYLAPHSQVGEK